MLGSAIIVFREVLEAALIIGIVMAACQGIRGRNAWVTSGIAGGLLGAAIVAMFAARIAAAAAGIGQELLNAAILFVAVLMLGWHNVWMARHARDLAAEVGVVSRAVSVGSRPLYALAIVVGVAVLREGAETVLFLHGIAAGGSEGRGALLAGGLMGVVTGAALGVALYAGLLRIPLQRLFAVTSWMILLLAAGMAAQGVGFLVQADLLPPFGEAIWDTSVVLTETSIPGKVLHTLIGYVSQPSGIQVIAYLATIAVIGVLMRKVGRSSGSPWQTPPAR